MGISSHMILGAMKTTPRTPINLFIQDVAFFHFTDVYWTAGGTDETGFEIWMTYTPWGGSPSDILVGTVGAGVQKYRNTYFPAYTVFDAGTYDFKVRAFNAFGYSLFSNIASRTQPMRDERVLWSRTISTTDLATPEFTQGAYLAYTVPPTPVFQAAPNAVVKFTSAIRVDNDQRLRVPAGQLDPAAGTIEFWSYSGGIVSGPNWRLLGGVTGDNNVIRIWAEPAQPEVLRFNFCGVDFSTWNSGTLDFMNMGMSHWAVTWKDNGDGTYTLKGYLNKVEVHSYTATLTNPGSLDAQYFGFSDGDIAAHWINNVKIHRDAKTDFTDAEVEDWGTPP